MNGDAIEMEIDVLLGDLLGAPGDVPQLRTRIGDLILRICAGNWITRLSALAGAGGRAVSDTSGSHRGPR